MENAPTFGPARPPAADPLAPPAFDRRRVRRWGGLTAVFLLLAYLALQNRYWVPGGDSDFYISVARSMARGNGFLYNGLPINISPPGWPWLMAQVMRVSPTFLALKLLTMGCMFGSLMVGYFVALRFLKPKAAAVATALAGMLLPVYSLTYFTHSEGLYCLLSATALLLALRVREGRGGRGHVAMLLAVCATLPLVRWAGVFQLLPIAAVLVSGAPGLPWAKRHWKTALACCLTIIGVWIGTRMALAMSAEMKILVEENAPNGEIDIDGTTVESKSVEFFRPAKDEKHGLAREYADRVVRSGKWFAWLLWQPTRFVQVSKPADVCAGALGWSVIALLAYLAVVEARRGEWLWVSLGLYTGAICLNWDNINSRYFVPVAPLIVVGLLLSTRRLGAAFPMRTFDAWKWLRRGGVYSILFCNLAMYGVDVIVMRSGAFYKTFEAGQHKDLIAAAKYLMSLPPSPPPPATQPTTMRANGRPVTRPATMPADATVYAPDDADLLVNDRYENLGKARSTPAGSRAMALLTDRFVKPLDGRITRVVRPPTTNPRLARIMRYRKTEWYMAQEASVPWRVWHFHLPAFLQKRLSKDPDQPPGGGWAVYRFDRINSTFTPHSFPPVENWPTRVPGM